MKTLYSVFIVCLIIGILLLIIGHLELFGCAATNVQGCNLTKAVITNDSDHTVEVMVAKEESAGPMLLGQGDVLLKPGVGITLELQRADYSIIIIDYRIEGELHTYSKSDAEVHVYSKEFRCRSVNWVYEGNGVLSSRDIIGDRLDAPYKMPTLFN